MKKIIVSLVVMLSFPFLSQGDEVAMSHSLEKPDPVIIENVAVKHSPKVDQSIQMECVWTSCRGTECSSEFVDEDVRAVYIDAFDNC